MCMTVYVSCYQQIIKNRNPRLISRLSLKTPFANAGCLDYLDVFGIRVV